MALSTIQASYNDDDDGDNNNEINTKKYQEEIDDQMAVINDPAFSVMSKIKLNLTPAIAIQVQQKSQFLHHTFFSLSFSSQSIQAVFLILKPEKFYTIPNMKICMHQW